MSELLIIEKFIYAELSGDSEIIAGVSDRIYKDLIPPQKADSDIYPCIVFGSMAPHDITGVSATRIAVRDIFKVEVISRNSSSAAIDSIADRIDALLHATRTELVDGTVFSCLRDQPLSFVEVDNSIIYHHRGGLYKIMANNT